MLASFQRWLPTVQSGPSASGCVCVAVGKRAVGTGAGSFTVREHSVFLISPPRPPSTITLLCLNPPSPWQHHMIARKERESSCCVCVCMRALHACLCQYCLIHVIAENLVKHIIDHVSSYFFSKGQNIHRTEDGGKVGVQVL